MPPDEGLVLLQDESRVISLHSGSSPRAADIAFASIADESARMRAVPGQLNAYVLHALGAEYSDLPTESLLRNGFHVRETPSGVRVVFVVTIKRGGDERTLLRTNLRRALISFGNELAGKTIWLPLMGTGAAGLSMETSLTVTMEVLLEAAIGVPGRPARVQIDLPRDLPPDLHRKLYRDAPALVMGQRPPHAAYRSSATVSLPASVPPPRSGGTKALPHPSVEGPRALVAALPALPAAGVRRPAWRP